MDLGIIESVAWISDRRIDRIEMISDQLTIGSITSMIDEAKTIKAFLFDGRNWIFGR